MNMRLLTLAPKQETYRRSLIRKNGRETPTGGQGEMFRVIDRGHEECEYIYLVYSTLRVEFYDNSTEQ